jgi:8-oxo-dGTP pyrophosphatase MutT (NUDIX family)
MELKKWRLKKSEFVLDNKWVKVRKDSVVLPDGKFLEDFYVVVKNNWSIIFCVTRDNEVVMVRQYRHGMKEITLELPSGDIDEGETALRAAERELEEEAGYAADDFEEIAVLAPSPADYECTGHFFLAKNARKIREPKKDSIESTVVELVPLNKVLDLVRCGKIVSVPHVAAIYLACDKLGLLALEKG